MRKASSNWLGKVVMIAVVGFLVISFAIWGIGDIFRGFGRSTVAKIGRTEITIEQFRLQYNDKLQQYARQFGRPISSDQARAMGLDRLVIAQLIADIVLDGAGLYLAGLINEVAEYLEKLRLTRRRDNLAGDLAYSEQRILEMGMALATDPAVLILDEPTAGMSRDETTYIVDLIRRVTEGRTLLVVEHDMSVVFTLCDQVSVLVYGEIIASGEPAAVRADRKVQEAYLGEEVH